MGKSQWYLDSLEAHLVAKVGDANALRLTVEVQMQAGTVPNFILLLIYFFRFLKFIPGLV